MNNFKQINKYLQSKIDNNRYSIIIKAINISDEVTGVGGASGEKADTLKFKLYDNAYDFFTTHIVATSAFVSCKDIRAFLDSIIDYLLCKLKSVEKDRYNAVQRVANKLKYEVYSKKN